LIVVPASLQQLPEPYGHETLASLVSFFTVEGDAQGLAICKRILAIQGAGHTAVITTRDQERARRFGLEVPASRILVNVMAALGCLGVGSRPHSR
jgi:acyl-CoA reductase-like NAD-dependent aldehyde dehydrogenase